MIEGDVSTHIVSHKALPGLRVVVAATLEVESRLTFAIRPSPTAVRYLIWSEVDESGG
jgi:hypothetical protein